MRRRRWTPEILPEPELRGPPRVFLSPPSLRGPQFLDAREQEALVGASAALLRTSRLGGLSHQIAMHGPLDS